MPVSFKNILFLLLLVLVLGPSTSVYANRGIDQERNTENGTQKTVLKGVVWTPPSDPIEAQADLKLMKFAGIEAVRTPIIQSESILSTADQLGIHIFQELPIRSLGHSSMMEKLRSLEGIVMTLFQKAEAHPSARHFGIFDSCDNSEKSILTELDGILQSWKERAPEGTKFYFIPAFIDDDCCSSAFDFALVGGHNNEDAVELLDQWNSSNDTPIGFSSFGMNWISSDGSGHGKAGSVQRAARFLEDRLPEILDNESIPAVFIEHWRDIEVNTLAGDKYSGLLSPAGEATLVHEVVAGIYSSNQTEFAINRGPIETSGPPHWAIFFAWIIVAFTGLIYGYSSAFQGLIKRYFVGHNFYLQEVKAARNISASFTFAITCLSTLIFGVLISTLFSVASDLPRFDLVLGILPTTLNRFIVLVDSVPWLGLLGSMIFYMSYLLLCSIVLTMASRIGQRISLYQAMLVVVGARWMLVVPFVLSTFALTLPDEYKKWAIIAIVVCMVVLFFLCNGRAVLDYAKLTNIPLPISLLIVLLIPIVLILVVTGWAFSEGLIDSLGFLGNLLTRA